MHRLTRILLSFMFLALPLLACGPLARRVAQPGTGLPGSGGTPIAWDALPLTAPCRIAAAFALTTNGLIYSQGGVLPGDPIDPATGTYYSRTGPRSYDCSGMTQTAYAQAHVSIGATTFYQRNDGTTIPCTAADLRGPATTCWATGDLAVFLNGSSPYHVAMYVRDGLFAECLNHQEGCRVWERPPSSFGTIVVRRIVSDCVRAVQRVVGEWGTYPATYPTTSTIGIPFTYTGWHAQVLHFLFAQFPGFASTYAEHDRVGGGLSVDLWTDGALYGRDNAGMPSMDALAEFIAANLDALGIRYVIWQQHVNDGSGWRLQADLGNVTQNHLDHIHITYDDVPPAIMTHANDSRPVSLWDVRASVVVARGRRRTRVHVGKGEETV